MNEKILNVIKELKEKSKKRNFSQTFDLIINLKEIDLKKPENKINEDFLLPHGRGKETGIVIFSDSLKVDGVKIFATADLEKLAKDKRAIKNLVKENEFFFGEPKAMPLVGKILGQFLGPRGKVPKVLAGDVNSLVRNYKRAVKIRVKDSPVIHCMAGSEKQKDEEVAENIEAVLKFLETKLPQKKANIGKVMLKLTMSKPIKLEV